MKKCTKNVKPNQKQFSFSSELIGAAKQARETLIMKKSLNYIEDTRALISQSLMRRAFDILAGINDSGIRFDCNRKWKWTKKPLSWNCDERRNKTHIFCLELRNIVIKIHFNGFAIHFANIDPCIRFSNRLGCRSRHRSFVFGFLANIPFNNKLNENKMKIKIITTNRWPLKWCANTMHTVNRI